MANDILKTVDIVPREELTGFVRELEFATWTGPSSLERFLPVTTRLMVEWTFDKADRSRARMGRYRPFNVESGLQDRPGFSRISGSIPPISEKMLLTEEDRLRLEVLRFGGNDSVLKQEIQQRIFDDAEYLTEAIVQRYEYARAVALRTGTVTFTADETGMKTTIDYNDGSDAVQTATAATLWSVAASATPLTNMWTWMDSYRTANRQAMPVVGLTSRRVLNAAMMTTEVKDFFTANGTTPAMITEANFQTLLQTYGIPPLQTYDTVVNLAGTDTRCLPDNEILWLPAPDTRSFGEFTVGVTADALDMALEGGIDLQANGPGLTGRAWKDTDPPQTWTRVGGLAIPVIKNPKLIMRTTVLS